MASLAFGMEERAYLFASWVAPIVYLMAQAYAPREHGIAQLNMVHRVAMDLTTWHLPMPIVALPVSKVGLGQVWLGMYVQWVHNHTFVQSLLRLASVIEVHAGPFRRWASGVGLVMEPACLPYLQLAPIS